MLLKKFSRDSRSFFLFATPCGSGRIAHTPSHAPMLSRTPFRTYMLRRDRIWTHSRRLLICFVEFTSSFQSGEPTNCSTLPNSRDKDENWTHLKQFCRLLLNHSATLSLILSHKKSISFRRCFCLLYRYSTYRCRCRSPLIFFSSQ